MFQSVAGTIEFQPGERYKYIFVNITDNSIPELEKSFKVELLNLEGGGKTGTCLSAYHDATRQSSSRVPSCQSQYGFTQCQIPAAVHID